MVSSSQLINKSFGRIANYYRIYSFIMRLWSFSDVSFHFEDSSGHHTESLKLNTAQACQLIQLLKVQLLKIDYWSKDVNFSNDYLDLIDHTNGEYSEPHRFTT